MKCKKLILAIILTTMLGIFTTCSPAYAAETLAVTAAWVDGDLLKLQVTDKNGVESTMALRLSDYMDDTSSEYISVQAVDLDGNKSGVIQVKNPYYVPPDESAGKEEIPDITLEIVSAQPDVKPLTPDGSGTVMDNVFDDNGKEIFSIVTEDGNVFYMIVDRERTSDNVYLLNAVTEEDLIALAQKSGRTITPDPVIIPTAEATISTVPAEQNIPTSVVAEPEIKDKMGVLNNNTLIFLIIAVLGVVGAGYYFKVRKKKKKAAASDDEDSDDYDDKIDDDELEDGDGDDE